MIIIMIFLTESIHSRNSSNTNTTVIGNRHFPVRIHARIHRINKNIFFKRFGTIYSDLWIKLASNRLFYSKELYITTRAGTNMSDFMWKCSTILIGKIRRAHPECLGP